MSSVHASRDCAVDAECNAKTFHISILIGRGSHLCLQESEGGWRQRKKAYLLTITNF